MRTGDFVLASSKDSNLSKSYGGGAIQTILKAALENKYVDKVLSFQEKKSRYDLSPVVIEQPDQIDALPLSQFSAYYVSGASNIPKYLQQNLKGAGKIAIVAKPCDVRALVELAKRRQVNLDDLIILGEECLGKISPKKVKKTLDEEQVDASNVDHEIIKGNKYSIIIGGENKSYNLGETLDLEESCKRCTERKPNISDISFRVIEANGKTRTLIRINSEKGLKLLESASEKLNLEEANEETLNSINIEMEQLRDEAEKYKAEQFKIFEKSSEKEGYSDFKKLVENCRKCGMCIKACPICVCVDCSVIKKRKEIDPVFYFLLRMGHMGECCVNCGNCDSVCNFLEPGPSLIFHRLSELSKTALNYEPGKNVNEPLPRTKKTIKKS
ncbi:MAG: Coenzyme F420 hydrogenase/dehydrogenase, beta subunit C-terminal domain [Candidatus Freyarchaeum deiterrae]